MHLKVKEDGRVRPRSAMLAVGINRDSYREVLSMMLGDTESESSWSEFVSRLKTRGLVRAIRQCLFGGTWQRCHTRWPKG